MTQLDIQNRIRTLMARFVAENKLAASTNNTDTNQVSEDALLPLFREIYDYSDLRNLNHSEKLNYPGIDLADDTARIAIQVTATATVQKIKDTLTTFVSRKDYKRYDRLIIFFLKEKPAISKKNREDFKKISGDLFNFDPSRDIQDSTDILKGISHLEIRKQDEVLTLLEYQFGDDRKGVGNVQQLLSRYRTRIIAMSSTFTVAGLQVALPIESAWIQLNLMNESRKNAFQRRQQYQAQFGYEWDRLADRTQSSQTDAESIAQISSRLVIVAGPGAGKSTLLRRLAYRCSMQRKNVVWIRLPFIARSMQREGKTFKDALISEIVSKSRVTSLEADLILSQSNFLLADGLDECGGFRSSICKAVVEWGHSYEDCQIVVTTRPVGHDLGLFPGWSHYELQPLGTVDTFKFVQQILEGYYKEAPENIEHELEIFKQHNNRISVASLSARNPLLLGFLINLSIRRVEIGTRRVVLYQQILRLIQDSSPNDRDLSESLEAVVAIRFLEVFGWLLQDSPTMAERELVDAAGKLLADELGTSALNAKGQAQQAIQYWNDRQLLERVSTNTGTVISFIHPTLAEYCAGCHIANWDDKALKSWIGRVCRQYKWQETILLAAGSGVQEKIIRTLIDLDNVEDPLSTEAVLATKILKEASHIATGSIRQFTDGLLRRLTSPVPVVVFESMEACIECAKASPLMRDSIGSLAARIVIHSQPWTRIAAWILTIECGNEFIKGDLLERQFTGLWSPLFKSRSLWSTGYWDFVIKYLPKVISFLLDRQINPETLQSIGDILSSRKLTIGMKQSLMAIPQIKNYPILIERRMAKWILTLPNFEWPNENIKKQDVISLQAENVLLNAIVEATQHTNTVDVNPKFPSLSALISGIGVYDHFTVHAYWALAIDEKRDVLVAVIQAAIIALNLDAQEIWSEANYILMHPSANFTDSTGSRWLSGLMTINIMPNWSKSLHMEFSGTLLAQALNHPSEMVADIAAELIVAGCRPSDLARQVEYQMKEGRVCLFKYVGIIAPYLWNEDSGGIFLQRLEGELTDGTQYLFIRLHSFYGSHLDERAMKCFERGLFAKDIDVASGASQGLLGFVLPQNFTPVLRKALQHWSIEEEKYFSDLSLSSSTPRPFLLQAIWKLQELDVDELIAFYQDKQREVKETVIGICREAMQNSTELRASFLQRISDSRAPLEILEKFLALSTDTLREFQSDLIVLLNSPSPSVRRIITQSLGTGWIDHAQSLQLCEARLNDEDPSVRSQATLTLRALSQ